MQRSRRLTASSPPRQTPNVSMASSAYREHEGMYRHVPTSSGPKMARYAAKTPRATAFRPHATQRLTGGAHGAPVRPADPAPLRHGAPRGATRPARPPPVLERAPCAPRRAQPQPGPTRQARTDLVGPPRASGGEAGCAQRRPRSGGPRQTPRASVPPDPAPFAGRPETNSLRSPAGKPDQTPRVDAAAPVWPQRYSFAGLPGEPI